MLRPLWAEAGRARAPDDPAPARPAVREPFRPGRPRAAASTARPRAALPPRSWAAHLHCRGAAGAAQPLQRVAINAYSTMEREWLPEEEQGEVALESEAPAAERPSAVEGGVLAGAGC